MVSAAQQSHAIATVLAAVVFSAYYATLCPTVPSGDAGELIQVAIEAGVVHPPGYPTWTMMAYAFARFVPYGEPAWRVNLSSAVCGSIASFLLSAAVGMWASCAWTGALAGGAFAFAPLVWEYSVQGEVFALNNLNNALLLYLLVWYERKPCLPRACAGALAIGLALCNQHTLVFFCAPYAVWALGVGGTALATPRALGSLALSGLLGLSPYVYLPVASGPHAAWGSWGEQRSLSGFLESHSARAIGYSLGSHWLLTSFSMALGFFFGVRTINTKNCARDKLRRSLLCQSGSPQVMARQRLASKQANAPSSSPQPGF